MIEMKWTQFAFENSRNDMTAFSYVILDKKQSRKFI